MKLNDNVYAVVETDGTIEDNGEPMIFDYESDAEDSVGDLQEECETQTARVVPVTLIPTAELARLRECERVLKLFARGHEYADEEYGQRPDRYDMTLNPYDRAERSPTFGDCRRAAELLSPATHTADEGAK